MADVDVRGVSKRYDEVWAAKQVSFAAPAGSFTSLLGPSGCGKTTTLRMIAGFAAPDEGEVRIGGAAVDALPPWKRNLGVVFQNYALFPFMTVFDNVAFGLRRRRVPAGEASKRVAEALELVGLPQLEARYPRQLSGGQQQRVALARALVIRPEVLLLDEPLSNLDAKLRAEMRFELKRIQRESGVTTIFVTHDQEEALTLSEQIIVMGQGSVRGVGTPKEMWERPRSAFVADFLGVENLLKANPAGRDGEGRLRFAVDGSGTKLFAAAVDPFNDGSGVIVGIRSGDIEIHPGPPTGAENEIAGEVREFTYLGASIAYQIRTALRPEPLIASGKEPLSIGARVHLRLPPDRLMVLRADTLGPG